MKIPPMNEMKRRSMLIVVVLFLGFACVIGRMAWWQIVKGESLAETAKKMQTAETAERANRGDILDRNGKVLAESASVNTLVCNPTEVQEHGDLNECIRLLSPIIGVGENKLRTYLNEDTAYQVIKKRLSAEESDAIESLLNPELSDENTSEAKAENEEKERIQTALSGVYFENDSKRYYPYNIASHVLGFTGFDNNGIQGIELRFEDYLSGADGKVERNRSAGGTDLKEQQAEYLTAAQKGCNVTLTIDETIQHLLEKQLEEAVETNELKEGAAGIVMDPNTGEILAMATKPDFDCNNPYDITQFMEYAIDFEPEYDDEDEDNPDATPCPTEDPDNPSDEFIAQARSKMWRDKAVSDTYEPGSTFKIITAAAALEEGVVDENTNFYCPGFKIVADRNIGCSNKSGHGAETFVEGVKNSCNPVFMDVGLSMGADTFMDYFEAFGFEERTGIELGGEANGIFYDTMSEVDLATSSFGQGFQITPLQLITAVSAVINGGERKQPLIVKEISDDNGVIKTYEQKTINRVISESTSERMRTILEQVVSDPAATGKNAYVKGYRIGGKTGTTEKAPRGSDKRIASFIGFAPANDPELVCLIMLDEPQTENKYGGTIAAPVAGELLAQSLDYMGVSKQYSEDETPDEYTEVPELRGLSVGGAKEKATAANFTYIVKGEGKTVVDQLPAPGEMMEDDSVIIIYTEDREEDDLVSVPDLTGLSEEDAKIVLNNNELNFEISGAGHSEAYSAYASSQTVEKDTKVLPGTVIGVSFRQQTSD